MYSNYEQERYETEEKVKRGDLADNPLWQLSGAATLIILGVIFLLWQNGVLNLADNWWAIFIALPAAVMLYSAYLAFNRAGRVTSDVRKYVTGGTIVAVVAFIAATNQWAALWPLFLIVPGILMLFGFIRDEKSHQ